MSKLDFKVGDWVVTHPTPNSLVCQSKLGGTGYFPNILGQITKIGESEYIKAWYICITYGNTGAIYEGNFRHATEEEIRLGKPIINKIYKIW